jgi:hypothetical protein
MRFETVSGKARIAANSRTIGKIRNAEGGRFGLIDAVHELIRGSLSYKVTTGTDSPINSLSLPVSLLSEVRRRRLSQTE